MSHKHKHKDKHKHNEDNNSYFSSIKSKVSDWNQDFLYTLKHTSAEIFIGAALGGIGLGLWSYDHESDKNRTLRLAFSDIDIIERHANFDNVKVPNMTEFLSKTSDFYMKVFESHNNSWKSSFLEDDNTRHFANELEFHLDRAFHQHKYEFPQLSSQIPSLIDSVEKELSYLKDLKTDLDKTALDLKEVWDDDHDDNYILVPVKVGKVTTLQRRYISTDNDYVYYPEKGERASRSLINLRHNHPKISIDNLFMLAKETSAENEDAILRSQKEDFKDKRPTIEDYLRLTNNWAYGSEPYRDFNIVIALQEKINGAAEEWKLDKNTAKSYSKRTYNHSHAESKEFLTSENAMANSTLLSDKISEMYNTMDKVKIIVPKLMADIKEYIDKSHIPEEESRANELKDEIYSNAMDGFKELYPAGLKLEKSNWHNVWLLTLLGLAIGGAIGKGVDYITDKNDFYDRFLKNKKKDYW